VSLLLEIVDSEILQYANSSLECIPCTLSLNFELRPGVETFLQCNITEDLVYSQAVAMKNLGLLVRSVLVGRPKRGSLDT
jgi:hypothetical protein